MCDVRDGDDDDNSCAAMVAGDSVYNITLTLNNVLGSTILTAENVDCKENAYVYNYYIQCTCILLYKVNLRNGTHWGKHFCHL